MSRPKEFKQAREPTVITGAFAVLRAKYLKEKMPDAYMELVRSGELLAYLHAFQRRYELVSRYRMDALARERNVTAELLEKDPFEWILRTEKIMQEVREELVSEILSS